MDKELRTTFLFAVVFCIFHAHGACSDGYCTKSTMLVQYNTFYECSMNVPPQWKHVTLRTGQTGNLHRCTEASLSSSASPSAAAAAAAHSGGMAVCSTLKQQIGASFEVTPVLGSA